MWKFPIMAVLMLPLADTRTDLLASSLHWSEPGGDRENWPRLAANICWVRTTRSAFAEARQIAGRHQGSSVDWAACMAVRTLLARE